MNNAAYLQTLGTDPVGTFNRILQEISDTCVAEFNRVPDPGADPCSRLQSSEKQEFLQICAEVAKIAQAQLKQAMRNNG